LDSSRKLKGNEKVFGPEAETLWLWDGGPVAFKEGQANLPSLMALLRARGINGLLVEGGGATITGFIASGLVDRLELFVAPRILGAGPSWVENLRIDSLFEAPRFELVRVRRLGPDLQLSYDCVRNDA
jgi:diaminohydroxyphosphoribosylaminopyrimidine deaminase/5-amino-6-(5-phosphoribosylamino)uracil reductase